MCSRWGLEDLGGMSDLCLYELEDNVWDEFGDSDDHIVPHSGNKHADKSLAEGDSRKKPQSEVIGVASNGDTSTTHYTGGKGNRSIPFVTDNNTMLEKGSWSDTLDGVFPSCDTDSIKEVTSLASDGTRISNNSFKSDNVESGGSEFCVDDSIMGDGCTAVDNSLYRYPLSRIPQTGYELSFFDNDREDRENGDLLYYGWPDIGNFEDVDRMFRSCDSTFGMESLNNDEELSWFSSSNATEGSEDALKSGLKFAGPNAGSSKGVSEHYDAFKPGIEQHKQIAGPNSMSYNQRQLPYMHVDHTRQSDQISVCPTPSVKSEKDGKPSSLKESSYGSNQLQCMENFRGPLTETPIATISENTEKPHSCQGFQSSFIMNFENAATTNPVVFGNKVSKQKEEQKSENQIGGHSDIEGASNEIPAEVDSSNLQESSCMSSVLDDISLEATSFLQLQQVMEKLDVRTKLCIRDSLYRLARSAEQRHNCANQRGGYRDNGDATGALMVEETSKCTGFMDMETDTNPIDRSIAHLLFHRPSDPSRVPSNDSLSLRSHALIHESISSPPVMAEKQAGCEEETIADGRKETLMTDDG
ncbi:protein LNK1 [Morus notabilis]|uniref:protein LNK1 n=1 Tax=Morus notabilis TaxID=981085 RepID=UPI000CED55FC|nr:protein LNK1 [Morus notabilis]XP_024019871.1 protein LNK1 [Morus notabilis]